MADPESMRKHVECPICLEIPRDGIMLQCRNGHNICTRCKSKLTDSTVCPEGRCGYSNPPTRNRTVASLIESIPFEFQCKYSNSSCWFKSSNDVLKHHEMTCKYRTVPCPGNHCKEFVSANRIIEHYETVHNITPRRLGADRAAFKVMYICDRDYNTNSKPFGWDTHPIEVNTGWMFPRACFQEGLIYLWLQTATQNGIKEILRCQVTLSKADCLMSFTAPVYPIEWNRGKIMKDEGCVCLSFWSVRKVLTEVVKDGQKRKGFRVKFHIFKDPETQS